MNQPHIVIVNDFGHINGGAGQVALGSAIALARRGFKVTAFVAVPPVMEELESAGVRVVCTGQHQILTDPSRRRAALQGVWNRKASSMMKELLDSLSPAETVIHLHGWAKALSSSIARPAISRGFKIVCTLHDYFAACPNGGFFNYQVNQVCKLRAMSPQCLLCHCDPRSYPQKLWRFARNAVQLKFGGIPRELNAFIAVSRMSREILAPYLPANAAIHEVRNPIDAIKDEPVAVEQNDAFISVGRLGAEKGLGLFAVAAASVRAPAVVVGEGPMRDELARKNPAMEMTGWQSRAEVARRLRQARALVFPSIWYETLGLVVLEAAALGVPAIVSDSCAARDSVRDGVTGLWFKGGDAEDLAIKIRKLMDPAEARRLGRAAYDGYWSIPSTMDDHVEALGEVYKEMLKT